MKTIKIAAAVCACVCMGNLTQAQQKDSYQLVRKTTASNESFSTMVMLKNLPTFTCAIKVVEAGSYHRGLVDGAKQAGGECHTATYELKELAMSVRVEKCEEPATWIETEYVCEKEATAKEEAE